MTYEEALGILRVLISSRIPFEDAIQNPAVPAEYRDRLRQEMQREEVFTIMPARVLVDAGGREDWLSHADRHGEYYWQEYRRFLLGIRGMPRYVVRSIDEITDRILGQLAPPYAERFDVRGLVIGYVQSGKTANYTALIAKAADAGYRLVIVLTGMDNGLRLQTQLRLKRELVGYPDYLVRTPRSVPLPPPGLRWHEFTRPEINGDFQPGANHAALQGTQPVLLVIKKNGPVLRKLIQWIDDAPEDVKRTIPLLLIDDEADQASIDTRGSYQLANTTGNNDYEPPSAINAYIRRLLRKFQKSAYVAYTATPFANILIPHDNYDPGAEDDLYPRDFIIDLPKPEGYFGAEELFGIPGDGDGNQPSGLNVIRNIPIRELDSLFQGQLPRSLELALYDFILAGSARAQRGDEDKPATMLIHISHLIEDQSTVEAPIIQRFSEIQEEWRYQPTLGIRDTLRQRWEEKFRPITQRVHPERDVAFEQLEPYIGRFLNPLTVRVKVINSETGDVLDYERNPRLKAIAIGGNRLSRGLTLEGLIVSYFVRPVETYDTLMQMGRWFGFRQGYEDLTRIYTTWDLANAFSNLASAEHHLRQDIRVYEEQGLTPLMVGVRIQQHPGMQVTNRLKRRFAQTITMAQSYMQKSSERVMYPLNQPDVLCEQEDENLRLVREFFAQLGTPHWDSKGPVWSGVPTDRVLAFLEQYRAESDAGEFTIPLIRSYIERRMEANPPELTRWTVAVRGLESENPPLGEADWGVPGGHIWQITRTRIPGTSRLGAITSPDDEKTGLSPEQLLEMERIRRENRLTKRMAARTVRPMEEGLLLLYPVSRFSGYNANMEVVCDPESRTPLYENPNDPRARDLIGVSVSFPRSRDTHPVRETYTVGTVPWRAEE